MLHVSFGLCPVLSSLEACELLQQGAILPAAKGKVWVSLEDSWFSVVGVTQVLPSSGYHWKIVKILGNQVTA